MRTERHDRLKPGSGSANPTRRAVSRRARGFVYALFLLTASFGFLAASAAAPTPETPQAAQAAVQTGPIPAPLVNTAANAATCFGDQGPSGSETVFGEYYSCDPTVSGNLAQVNPENSSPPIACDLQRSNGCFWKYAENPSGLLPAWRWRDNVGLYSNMDGLDGIVPTLFSFLASVFFAISQLAWWILLEVCQWVLTDSLVQDAGGAMNKGYTMLTDLINASGLLLFAGALGLFILVRLLLRGRLVKVTGMVLAFVIPIGLMQGLAMQANKAPSNAASAPEWVATDLPTGSPAWMAVSGVNLVDGLTSWFTSGFGRLATISGSMQIQQASAVDPSCSSYVAALYDQYYTYASSPIRDIRTETKTEFERQMNTFTSSAEAIRMKRSDPFLYSAVYSQVSRDILTDVQISITPPDPAAWEGLLNARSNAEKLVDARHYKVATVSQLWQRAFAGTWTAAQFGNQVYGAKMYCHLLEWNADISPEEQKQVAGVANRYSYVTGFDGSPVKSAGYEGISLGAFEKGSGKAEMEQHLFAWAACRRAQTADGSWKWLAEPAWAALGNGHGMSDDLCEKYFSQNEGTMEEIRNKMARTSEGVINEALSTGCGFGGFWDSVKTVGSLGANCVVEAFNGAVEDVPYINNLSTEKIAGQIADTTADTIESGAIDRTGSIKPLKFDDEESVDKAVRDATELAIGNVGTEACQADPQSCAAAAVKGFEEARDAGKMVKAFKGNNPSQRLTLSILALITSIIYAYTLGFLALGSFIAKFGLVLMIIMLPATLLAIAWPGSGGEKSSTTGKKMLRLTGGFILSHGMLAFTLGLLLSTILLFESFLGGDGGSFIHALIPIASLFIVRQLLKMAGLGDLGSIQGAVGMPLSASLAAAGKDWQRAGMDKFGGLTGGQKFDPKTGQWRDKGLSRLDSLAKRTGKGALMFAPNKAAALGKWSGRKVSDRYALPERKAQLLGKFDADGNLVEAGLRQRMKNLAGLMAIAGKVPGLGHLGRAVGSTGIAKDFSSFAKRSSWVRTQIAQDAKYQEDMRRRRENILAVSGKNQKERYTARVQYQIDRAEARRAEELALRDDDGNIVRDASGSAIYGYRYAAAVQTRLGTPMLDAHGNTVYALADADTGRRLDAAALDRIPMQDQQRNAAGSLITGRGGAAIYGWSLNDGTGSRVLDFDEYRALTPAQKRSATEIYDQEKARKGVVYVHDEVAGARYIDAKQLAVLPAAEQARATAVTDPRRGFLTDDELIAVSREYAERFQMRPGQAVMTVLGEPIVAPVMGDADGNNRMVVTKNAEASKDLAAHYRIQYLPNAEKSRPTGFTDDQYAVYLKLLNEYHNGYNEDGSLTDVVYELTGFTWDSSMGQRELNLLMEGKDGALKDYRPETPPDVLAAIQGAASQYSPRTEQKQIFKDIATERYETLSAVQLELAAEQGVIHNGTVQLEGYQVQMRTAAPKLKSVRSSLDQLSSSRTMVVDVAAEVADLEVDMRALESTIATLSASSAPAARASLSVKTAELATVQAAHAARQKALDDLEDAVRKAAASEAAWMDEERRLNDEVKRVADEIASVSRTVFDSSKKAEELGKQMEFAFKAFRRDKGKEDWSKIDDMIDDWIKGHNNKWAADGRDLRALEEAFQSAITAGEEVHMRKAYDELASVLNRLGRTASRASASGAAYHGYIISDLAKLEGNMRHVVETNPEVIPWTGKNYTA